MRELKIRTVCVVGAENYGKLEYMRLTLDHPSPDEDGTRIIFASTDGKKSYEDYLGLQIVREVKGEVSLWEVIS